MNIPIYFFPEISNKIKEFGIELISEIFATISKNGSYIYSLNSVTQVGQYLFEYVFNNDEVMCFDRKHKLIKSPHYYEKDICKKCRSKNWCSKTDSFKKTVSCEYFK